MFVAAGVGTIYVVAAGLASAGLAFLAPALPAMGGILLAIGAIALCVICMFGCCCPQPASSNGHTSRPELAGPFEVVSKGSSVSSARTLTTETKYVLNPQNTNQDRETSSRKSTSTHQSDMVGSLHRHSFVSETGQGAGSNDPSVQQQQRTELPDQNQSAEKL